MSDIKVRVGWDDDRPVDRWVAVPSRVVCALAEDGTLLELRVKLPTEPTQDGS